MGLDYKSMITKKMLDFDIELEEGINKIKNKYFNIIYYFYEEDAIIVIEEIEVKEEYRNHGIGTEVIEKFISLGYAIQLTTFSKDALRLYLKLGFEIIDESFISWDLMYNPYI